MSGLPPLQEANDLKPSGFNDFSIVENTYQYNYDSFGKIIT
jgi:hypothetical protein